MSEEKRPSANPSLDCLTAGHFWCDFTEGDRGVAISWCIWCGTGVSDPDRVDGQTGEPLPGVILTGPTLRCLQDYAPTEKGS